MRGSNQCEGLGGNVPARVRDIDEILTVADVAKELRCSKAHVYNVINGKVSGVSKIAVIRLGRRTLIRRSAVEQWKQENENVRG